VLVRDINPGEAAAAPAFLRTIGGKLFFIADDGEHGVELWTSDGSAEGTAMVKDIRPNGGAFGTDTFYFSFADLDDELFFAADDGEHGIELWRSDGTAPGTGLLSDINPGEESSLPSFLTRDRDRLLFQACEPATGCEIWERTPTRMRRVADIEPGPASSNPGPFTPAAGRVFFSAATAAAGSELWLLEPCGSDCDADGLVRIDELVDAVRIGLGQSPVAACSAADVNGDGRVSIAELVRAVNAALDGCD
jgi:ELWxxDGT repeat protein